MKNLMTIAIVAVAASSPFVTRADDAGPVGRYQLLYAITETAGGGSTIQNKSIWKIDTVTGQVWQFGSYMGANGPPSDAFVPIETRNP